MDYLSVLKNYGLKATPQRLAVLEILDEKKHPTMEQLHDEIKKNYPSVSLATVYKNVNTLKENGIITEVNMPNGKTRFDVFLEPHLHVVCKKCGEVKDIFYDENVNNFRNNLEQSIKNKITFLDITAVTEECEKCQSV